MSGRNDRPAALARARRQAIRYTFSMRQAQVILKVEARKRGLHEFTDEVRRWVGQQGIASGLLTLFCRHTSASLLIQENAAPAVRRDLQKFFDELAPEGAGLYEHDDEGPDDMPAHLKTALTHVQMSVPVMDGNLMLGTWQGIYLFEHRDHPSPREIVLHLSGT
jgi:secondary thiamine-phosphate synthase enzyme